MSEAAVVLTDGQIIVVADDPDHQIIATDSGETVLLTEVEQQIIEVGPDDSIIVTGPGPRGAAGPAGPPGAAGDTGPVGPPGPSSGLQLATFSFSAPATVWTIQHNLGTNRIRVLLLEADEVHEKEGNVTFPDNNTVQVEWYYPETGVARLFY